MPTTIFHVELQDVVRSVASRAFGGKQRSLQVAEDHLVITDDYAREWFSNGAHLVLYAPHEGWRILLTAATAAEAE